MTYSNIEIDSMKNDFRKMFESNGKITIDVEGIRAMSPSFAYECFGQLYESKEKLEQLLGNIEMKNDNLNFIEKIDKAIRRRIMVLS